MAITAFCVTLCQLRRFAHRDPSPSPPPPAPCAGLSRPRPHARDAILPRSGHDRRPDLHIVVRSRSIWQRERPRIFWWSARTPSPPSPSTAPTSSTPSTGRSSASLPLEMETLDRDGAIHCILLTGHRGACAPPRRRAPGEIVQGQRSADRPSAPSRASTASAASASPVIAAVEEAFALGGGSELAVHADVVVGQREGQVRPARRSCSASCAAPAARSGSRARSASTARWRFALTGDRFAARQVEDLGRRRPRRPHPVRRWPKRRSWPPRSPSRAPVATLLTKEAILTAFETPLESGLAHEKRLFAMLFSTDDQKEGMAAFIEKRPAHFTGK